MRRDIINLDERQRHQFAVMGKNGIGAGQLHQADRNAVTVGHGRLLDRRQFSRAQTTIHFAGKPRFGAWPKPTLSNISHISFGEKPRAILAVPTLEDFWMTSATVSAPCGWASEMVAADGHPPRGAVDDRIETNLAFFQRQRGGKRLHHRTRLEGVGNGTIAQLGAGKLRLFGL
jgi:hypothetical protein